MSAVDELAAQLQQEFDFRREAETMDTIRARLRCATSAGTMNATGVPLWQAEQLVPKP